MSIRFRLTLIYSGLLVVILFLFGLAVIGVLNWVLRDSLIRKLDDTATEIIASIRGPIQSPLPSLSFYETDLQTFSDSNVYVQVRDVQSNLIDRSENLMGYNDPLDSRALGTREKVRREVIIDRIPLLVQSQPIIIGDRVRGYIQVAVSLEPAQEAVNRVSLILLAGSLIALALALLVVGSLLGRALRPIETIAETATQITSGDDLSRRIPYAGPQDELGRLIHIFNATLDRLEDLFLQQRRFVADVSHELRTPLTVIQANVDIIRRYGTDPDSLEALNSEAQRMGRLVNDLLLLAQADAGKLPLRQEEVELDTVALEVVKQAAVLERAHAPVSLDRFEPVRITGDYDRLKQLLLNLVGNALKHTPDDGEVCIALYPDGKEAVLKVTDNGEGIPPEDLPRIFDRFYRVDKARARQYGGAGLGLAISKWIAEAHGGSIDVNSAPGAGSTFTVRLPLHPARPLALRESDAARAQRRQRPGTRQNSSESSKTGIAEG